MNEDFGPILEPEQVSFSFDAPGWNYLVIFCGLVISLFLIRALIIYQKNAYRRKAVLEVDQINDLGRINVILKSLSIDAFGRVPVAGLYGKPWIEFLLSKLTKHTFSEPKLCQNLNQSLTSSVEENAVREFKLFSIHWIKNHHV